MINYVHTSGLYARQAMPLHQNELYICSTYFISIVLIFRAILSYGN